MLYIHIDIQIQISKVGDIAHTNVNKRVEGGAGDTTLDDISIYKAGNWRHRNIDTQKDFSVNPNTIQDSDPLFIDSSIHREYVYQFN